jgi:succinyl-CoA synthetase alpha subunit
MNQAKEALQPDATLVYVAASGAARAIEDAIEAEIPLIVAVAEHIPLHDMLRVCSLSFMFPPLISQVQAMLRSQSKCRLVGANSPGMTSVHARCRLGFQPLPFFTPGCTSLVAKSGTMSYEAVAATTRAGLGQSYAIGIGGDDLPGTDFVDALKIFEHDPNTEGIVLVGEIGGYAEEDAASWIQDYRSRAKNPK